MKRRKAASKLIPPQPPWLSWERGAADPLGVSLCPEAGCHPSKDEGGGERWLFGQRGQWAHVGSGPSVLTSSVTLSDSGSPLSPSLRVCEVPGTATWPAPSRPTQSEFFTAFPQIDPRAARG